MEAWMTNIEAASGTAEPTWAISMTATDLRVLRACVDCLLHERREPTVQARLVRLERRLAEARLIVFVQPEGGTPGASERLAWHQVGIGDRCRLCGDWTRSRVRIDGDERLRPCCATHPPGEVVGLRPRPGPA
jgi:hypothetical protein